MNVFELSAKERRRICTKEWEQTLRGQMYRRWQKMVSRCHYEGDPSYGRYGAKGITVCEKWRNSFDAFLDDMGPPPKGMTLDRIDSNAGYSPDNCRWANAKTQSNNRKIVKTYTHKGKTMNLSDWSRALGMDMKVLYYRIFRAGLSFEEAIAIPITRSNCGRIGGLKGLTK